MKYKQPPFKLSDLQPEFQPQLYSTVHASFPLRHSM